MQLNSTTTIANFALFRQSCMFSQSLLGEIQGYQNLLISPAAILAKRGKS